MELTRRSLLVYGLLVAVWVLVLGWQVEEHHRVKEAAKTDLRNRSKDIANTLSAIIRGMRFRGERFRRNALSRFSMNWSTGRTNELVKSSELIYHRPAECQQSTALLVAGQAHRPATEKISSRMANIGAQRSVTLVNPVDLGASLSTGRHQHLHPAAA